MSQKRIVLAFKSNINVGDVVIEANTPVAVIESRVPLDAIISAAFANRIIELQEVKVDEQPAEPPAVEQVQPSSDQQSSQAVDEGSAGDAGSQETTAQETTIEGSQLANAGLAASLCKSLAGIGVVTVEQLQAKLEADPSLEGNDSISPSIAKRIVAWWASYQASK